MLRRWGVTQGKRRLKTMSVQLPDPKVIVGSVVGGAVEFAEGPVRVAESIADVAKTFATDARVNLETVKTRAVDDPSVIPGVAVKAAGQTFQAGLGMFEAVVGAVKDTVSAVRSQIKKVTG